MVIGSEGILGVITEAWMRIQKRPDVPGHGRASRSTRGRRAATRSRQIVQAKLWPANCRILDPVEAGRAAGLDGTTGARHRRRSSRPSSRSGTPSARPSTSPAAAGGHVDDDDVSVDDGGGSPTGRGGAVGAWRDAFIGVQLGVDTQPRARRRHVRDRDHVGPLARVRRRRA